MEFSKPSKQAVEKNIGWETLAITSQTRIRIYFLPVSRPDSENANRLQYNQIKTYRIFKFLKEKG